jgi:ubiquinone/menaquinone biosynthesis C-methylase UbiE
LEKQANSKVKMLYWRIDCMSHKGEAYSASGAIFLDNPIRRWIQPPFKLIEKLGINLSDVAMDFGCGPGFYTIELAKKAKNVVAVDLSPEMLKKAQNKAAKAGVKNIQFLQSNGTNIQLEDGSVDLILLATVYHEVGENEAVLKEFSRILKPDGKLVVVEVIKKGIFPGAPVQNPEALTAEIEAGNFKLDRMLPYKMYGIFFFSKKSSSL